MARAVDELDRRAVLGVGHDIDGRVELADGPDVLEIHVQGRRQDGAQDGAVREDGDGLIGMTGHDLLDTGERALAELREALAMRNLEDIGMLEEVLEGVGPLGDDFVVRQSLPVAEVELTQLRARLDRQAEAVGDAAGRLHRAREVARVDGLDLVNREMCRELLGLLDAEWRERDIRLALIAAEHIPLGLAMADKNDLCHKNLQSILSLYQDTASVIWSKLRQAASSASFSARVRTARRRNPPVSPG